MAERNERQVFEGKNRREAERRAELRRKADSNNTTMWKYIAIASFIAAFIAAFSV